MHHIKIKFVTSDKNLHYSSNISSSIENKNLLNMKLPNSLYTQNNIISNIKTTEKTSQILNGISPKRSISTSPQNSKDASKTKSPPRERSKDLKILQSILSHNNYDNQIRNNFKENNINDERYSTKKLYYTRMLSSDKKYKYKYSNQKLRLTFVLGEFEDILPSYIFGNKHFSFSPHCCYQLANKNKGYIISFENLIRRFKNKVIAYDSKILYTYIFKQKRGKQKGIDIKMKDFKTLNSGGLINDGIINFYFKLIEEESITMNKNYINNTKYNYNKNIKNKINVLALKSFFYNMLSNNQNEELSNNFTYPESCSYAVTKINIFKFKTLLVPICEKNHWSLIIVNNINTMHNIFDFVIRTRYKTDYIYEDLDSCDSNSSTEIYPEIYYLDSYYCNDPRRINIILKYLFYEFQKVYLLKYKIDYPQFNLTNFIFTNYKKIQCYTPDVPKQDNKFDCGIFILLYTELFLYDPDFFLKYARDYKKLELFDNSYRSGENNNVSNGGSKANKNLLKNWFSKNMINSKRKDIQCLIIELSNLQKKYSQFDENDVYYEDKLKDQSEIVEKYIINQKELYLQHFKKLEKETNF